MNVIIGSYLLGSDKKLAIDYFQICGIICLSYIVIIRFQAKELLYCLDLCWVVSFAACGFWFSLHMSSDPQISHETLIAYFALGCGPLSFAAMVLHNSLVFHSLRHQASCFIHGMPLVLNYVVRW